MQQDSPQHTRRPIYYGWWIVLSAFITIVVSHGLKSYVFGAFVKPVSDSLGWSRAAAVGVVPVNALLAGILAPLVGRHVDKHGPRASMFAGAILGGLALLALSQTSGLWQWYLFWLVFTIGDSFAGMVASNTVIANWFVKKRGTAMAISYLAVSVGGIVLVPVVTLIVTTVGWGWGFVMMGLILILIIAPVLGLIMRRRPEDMGLLPDGDEPQSEVASSGGNAGKPVGRPMREEPNWTLSQAIRTAPFWLVVLAYGCASATANIVSVHSMALATDMGIPPTEAAAAIGLLLVVALPGRFLYGWLADRMDTRYVMMLYMSGLAISDVAFSQARSLPMFYLAFIIYGLSVGGVNPVPPTMAARLFGRVNIGRIWGTISLLAMPLVAGAPLMAGSIFDRIGSYQLAFYIAATGLTISVVGIYFARRPVPSARGNVLVADR